MAVDMGEPILEPAKIPVELPRPFDGDRIVDLAAGQIYSLSRFEAVDGRCGWDRRMTCVSMGNPHVVLFPNVVAAIPLESLGPFSSGSRSFPTASTSISSQVHSPHEVTMRTWERGSGITLACGTGACAVCVAGALTGRTDRKILAHLPGGDLELHGPTTTTST